MLGPNVLRSMPPDERRLERETTERERERILEEYVMWGMWRPCMGVASTLMELACGNS